MREKKFLPKNESLIVKIVILKANVLYNWGNELCHFKSLG